MSYQAPLLRAFSQLRHPVTVDCFTRDRDAHSEEAFWKVFPCCLRKAIYCEIMRLRSFQRQGRQPHEQDWLRLLVGTGAMPTAAIIASSVMLSVVPTFRCTIKLPKDSWLKPHPTEAEMIVRSFYLFKPHFRGTSGPKTALELRQA